MTTHGRSERSAIDWAQLRERIDLAAAGPSAANEALGVEERRAVLDARAITLARPHLDPSSSSATRDVLVFLRGEERYAVELGRLIQVLRPRTLTSLPGAEHPVLALVAWRGRALTAIDVKREGTERSNTAAMRQTARVLVVDDSSGPYGIIVDEVVELRQLSGDDVLGLSDNQPNTNPHQGVTKDGITIVDLDILGRSITAPTQLERTSK